MEDRSIEQRLADMRDDPAGELALDGNAVAGILASMFAMDVTASPGRCASCGTFSMIATLRAYTKGPGVVLRCPACTEVVLRVVETPTRLMVDVSGLSLLRMSRPAS